VAIDEQIPARVASTQRPPIAWAPIGIAIAAATAVFAATANQYGFHRDELYFLLLPPRWGYVDQPPLTPLLAHGAVAVFGHSPFAVRIPAMLCLAVSIVLIALITRELGGTARAQGFAAFGFASAAFPMASGHLTVTSTVDLPFWLGVVLLASFALLRRQPRWWLAAGALAGLATYNKLLILLLLVALGVGLFFGRQLRSGWLWAGVALAALIATPNLVYQATHGYPQLTMAGAIAGRDERLNALIFQLLYIGIPLVGVCVRGARRLLRDPQLRPVKAFAEAYVVAFVITIAGGGQGYYSFGLLAVLFAAGAVTAGPNMATRRAAALIGVNAVISAVVTLPLLPVSLVGHTPIPLLNETVGAQVGWPTYVRTLAAVYHSLPADEQAHTVILTGNYGEAGAVAEYGRAYGLPSVYSGHNALYDLGPPPVTAITVVVWDEQPQRVTATLPGCVERAQLNNGVGVPSEEQGSSVLVCRAPTAGWAAIWPSLRHLN
jgi:4-amino-4-deoxy-L-arabinose transferase-like glycosyltransferase